MDSPDRGSASAAVSSVFLHSACGAALGLLATVRIGAGFAGPIGLVIGAIVGVFLTPIAIVLFRPALRSQAIGIAMACACIGLVLAPSPPLIGPVFANAVGAWIGAMVVLRILLILAPKKSTNTQFAIRGAAAAIVVISALGVLNQVRSWPKPNDAASALVVVDRAYRSNAMEVHGLGHKALALISEADADRLSRDADHRVRYQVARGLTDAQSDAFAREALDRLASDADHFVRSEALWSMARRWPEERGATADRMRADAHPMVSGSADRITDLPQR